MVQVCGNCDNEYEELPYACPTCDRRVESAREQHVRLIDAQTPEFCSETCQLEHMAEHDMPSELVPS